MKTYVYVDAFNLYFGCCKGTPFKWLDIGKLCQFKLPGHQIEKIKYFTARVHGRLGDPDQPVRQQVYLRALQTLPNLEIYYGHFLTHVVKIAACPSGTRTESLCGYPENRREGVGCQPRHSTVA